MNVNVNINQPTFNEIEICNLFIERHRGKFYYLYEADQWVFFDVRLGWIVEKQDEYKRSLWQNFIFQLKAQPAPSKTVDTEKWIKARKGWVNRYSSHTALVAVFKSLSMEHEIRRPSGEFDATPHLLGVKNGVVDLRNGSFAPHNIKTLVTSRTNVSYNPKAKADRWKRFVSEVVPKHEKYVQMMMGYSITGLTDLQKLWILTGDGSNGKSTFLETLMGIVGKDYSQKAAHNALLQTNSPTSASPEW